MAKDRAHTRYVCQECGAVSPRWMGRCPSCERFNTMVEERIQDRTSNQSAAANTAGRPPLAVKEVSGERVERLRTGIDEVDRVLGGGIVPGGFMLLGGDPGIGKSTLLLQLAGSVGASEPVIYITAEESLEQIRIRAERLGAMPKNLFVMAEDRIEVIEETLADARFKLAIVDSLQTVYNPEMESAPGSVSQVREVASRLMRVAKAHLPIFLVGHVNKEGSLRPVA
ncbi:MAG: AAA family ATPase [Firmicutes bacterium]|nr:AAA family ATPase [Bacillota bacterium]MCL5065354.1 AAA family ATPase [Bacillota bacterium]